MPDINNEIPSLLPPGWEMIEWRKKGGQLIVSCKHRDGMEREIVVYTLPMLIESNPLLWLKQVLDLKILWSIS